MSQLKLNNNGSRQETLNPGFVLLGTRQQGVPVILRELVLPDGFDPMSLSFIVKDVTTELSGPRPTDECQITRNLGLRFPVDFLQPTSKRRLHFRL
ncbi:unnamed protein product [Schistosoma curassoni]|uniref:Velvet domain-containing protein n=1 Tax=Schistosoma curassoni TaxID=6186 RepID=A0A183KM55_9TREM|nr:unnamed protein product [Schistosoma curassoni]